MRIFLSHFCHFQAPHDPSRELTDARQSLIVSQTDSSTGGRETKKIRRFSAWSTPPYWAKGMKKHNSTRSTENRKFSEHNVNDWKVRKMFPSTWTNLCCVWMRFFLLVIFLSLSLPFSTTNTKSELNLKVFHAISVIFHSFKGVTHFSLAARDAALSNFTTFTLLRPFCSQFPSKLSKIVTTNVLIVMGFRVT